MCAAVYDKLKMCLRKIVRLIANISHGDLISTK